MCAAPLSAFLPLLPLSLFHFHSKPLALIVELHWIQSRAHLQRNAGVACRRDPLGSSSRTPAVLFNAQATSPRPPLHGSPDMPGIPWTGKWTWEASDSSDDGETYAQALSSSSSRKRVARSRAGVLPARFRDSSFELPLHKVLDGGAARLQPPHKKPKSDHTSSRPTKRRSSSPTKNNFKPKTNTAAASRRSTSAASSSKPHSLYRIEEDFIYGSIDVDDEEEDDDADEASDTFAAPSVSSSDVELPRDSQFERGSPASSSLTPDMASTWLSALCTDPLMCMFAADGKPRKVTTLERISFAERVRRARARCTWATQQDKTVYWLRARTMDMRNVYIAIRDQLSPIGACTAVCIWPQDSPDRQLLAQLMQIHSGELM